MVLVWHPRCRQAAPGLLQTTMQIEWPTMSKMQNDCFGMTGLWWQYHHDHILKGRLFGRLVWLFFPVLHVYGWGGHRRWASRPRGPSGFKLLFYVTMGRTRRNVRLPSMSMVEAATGDEPLVPVAHPDSTFCFTSPWDLRTLVFRRNVWHITSMSGNRISIHRTNRKHAQYLVSDQEGFFYAIVHVVINTASTLCSFVCTKSICYVHNSCA